MFYILFVSKSERKKEIEIFSFNRNQWSVSIVNEGSVRKDVYMHNKKWKMALLICRMQLIDLTFLISHTPEWRVFGVKVLTRKLCICEKSAYLHYSSIVFTNLSVKCLWKINTDRWIKWQNCHHDFWLLWKMESAKFW